MTDELVYDPKTKAMIKDKIFDFLYAPVNKDFAKRLKTIIIKNSTLHGNGQLWLSYKGEYYHTGEEQRRPRPVNRLKPELKVLMDEYLEDLARLNDKELPYVLGFINQVLNSSNSLQDYFKIFPESMHKPIKQLLEKCACREQRLHDEMVEDLKRKNSIPIELMKKRMVLNLLV